jgi:hypothetical protein
MMDGMKLDVQELLDNHTAWEPNTGCRLWVGSTGKNGYAAVTREGQRGISVHRLIWQHFHGPIPPGMFVCHHCDVRSCLSDNVDGTGHLFLGTPADNIHDALSKGRLNLTGLMHQGEEHPNARLTVALVRSIRERAAREGKGSCTAMARELGMTVANICLIAKRKSWSWVE